MRHNFKLTPEVELFLKKNVRYENYFNLFFSEKLYLSMKLYFQCCRCDFFLVFNIEFLHKYKDYPKDFKQFS